MEEVKEVVAEEVKEVKEVKHRAPRAKVPAAVYPAEPANPAEIDMNYIMDYVEARGFEEWFLDLRDTTMMCKDGKEHHYGLFQIRSAFVKKFFPALENKKPAKSDIEKRIEAMRARVAKRKK